MNKCNRCKKFKDAKEFSIFRGKLNSTCKDCRVKNNLWYKEDTESKRSKARERYYKNRDKVSSYRFEYRLMRKYSLTKASWDKMLKDQHNKCAICGVEFISLKPCVDHDHKTGKVRALLCRNCNLRLYAIEDESFLLKAQKYLKSMK